MNEETRDAAWKYARCQNHNDRRQEDRSIKDFMSGAGWALRNLRWIPVTESLPKRGDSCLFIVSVENSHDNGRMLGGTYTGNPDDFTRYEFGTPGVGFTASHWCYYPEVLLNVPVNEEKEKNLDTPNFCSKCNNVLMDWNTCIDGNGQYICSNCFNNR